MDRDKIVKQAAGVVAACWNHYADAPLSESERKRVLDALGVALPLQVGVDAWKEDKAKQNAHQVALHEAEGKSERREPLDFGPGEIDGPR